MKRVTGLPTLLLVVFCVFFLVGCPSAHIITLKDGEQIDTRNTPSMNRDGFYEYQEEDGTDASINGDQVLKIEKK